MAVMSDNKGGGNDLSQAFTQNQAPQAATLPTITQPQNQFSVPELPQQQTQQPVMGSMAPQQSGPEMMAERLRELFSGQGGDPFPFGYGLRASDEARAARMQPRPAPEMPAQQPAPQMSEAQRLAQAINKRAANR